MRRRALHWVLLAIAALALLAPSAANAASVVNGDFESGSLDGWHVYQAIGSGNWFAYSGTEPPIGSKRPKGQEKAAPLQPPPQGAWAAISDEADPDTLILYQDIALEAGQGHQLSLLAYYNTNAALATPAPDTLSVDPGVLGGQDNQQFRIDVTKPTAPLESLEPSDILLNVFQTKTNGPKALAPTKLTADLSPFAGQTVRLRIAVADSKAVLNAGVDGVEVDAAVLGQPKGPSKGGARSGRLSFAGAKANRSRGTVRLTLRVPGSGLLRATGRGILPAIARPRTAGSVALRLSPRALARSILRRKHKLRVRVTVIFTPSDGSLERLIVPVVIRLV